VTHDTCKRCGDRTWGTLICKLCVQELLAQQPSGSALPDIIYVGTLTLVRV
jgi:hypothetical protein